jgi:tetratricopeptide (TPR) repeat protein
MVGVLALAARSTRKQAETDRAAAKDATAAAAEVADKAAELAEQNELLTDLIPDLIRTGLEANPVTIAEWAISAGGSVLPKNLGALGGDSAGAASAPSVGTPGSIALSIVGRMYVPAAEPATGADLSKPVSDVVSQALALWSQSAWGQVVELLNPYTEKNPGDFPAQEMRMAVAAQLRRFDVIVEATRPFVDSPYSGRAFVWRGMANLLLNKPDESLQDLTLAIKDPAQSMWARMLRGLVWIQMKMPSEALIDFDTILAKNPDFVLAHIGRASAFLAEERFRDAISAATKALELESQNADALVLRGDAYLNMTDYVAAERDYRAAKGLFEHDKALLSKWLTAYYTRLKMERESVESPPGAESPAGGASDARVPPRDPISDWISRQRQAERESAGTDSGGFHFPFLDFGRR